MIFADKMVQDPQERQVRGSVSLLLRPLDLCISSYALSHVQFLSAFESSFSLISQLHNDVYLFASFLFISILVLTFPGTDEATTFSSRTCLPPVPSCVGGGTKG